MFGLQCIDEHGGSFDNMWVHLGQYPDCRPKPEPSYPFKTRAEAEEWLKGKYLSAVVVEEPKPETCI